MLGYRKRRALTVAGIGSLAAASVAVASMALATPTPPPVSGKAATYLASPHPAQQDPSVFVAIGDSFTGGSNAGGSSGTPSNWVVAASNTLSAEGVPDVIGVERGLGGSGYVNKGPIGKVFGDMIAANLHPETDVVVFFGSINDQAQPIEAIRAAVDKAWTQAKKAAPNAKFIAIGPAWMRAETPDDILAITAVEKELAAKHGFEFIDPNEERWFQDHLNLIAEGNIHPTDEGHRFMAEQITPHLKALLTKKG